MPNTWPKIADILYSIADDEPDRADVWPPPLRLGFNPPAFLARHADRTAASLAQQAQDTRFDGRAQAVLALAEMVRHERDPKTRHLGGKAVEDLEAVVRMGLEDSDNDDGVRYAAIQGLAIMGQRSDILVLERIAETDPYFTTTGGASGNETRYFLREAARDAAASLRKRLDTESLPPG